MNMSEEETRARLIELHNMRLLPRTTVNYLASLRDSGVRPGVIYDIGACVLHWTNEAALIWPGASFYCFEAMPETAFLYDKPYIKGYHNGVLSDRDGNHVTFYQNTYHPGGNSYYKENVEVNPQAEEYFNESHRRDYITKALDMVVLEKNFPLPDIVKMDVQGAELDIIKGAPNCINNAYHLILELQVVEYNKGAPLVQEVVSYLDNIGYKMVGDGPFSNAGPDGDYHFVNTKKFL